MNMIPDTDRGHLAHAAVMLYEAASEILEEARHKNRKSTIFRDVLKIYIDGDMWCVLYGENIQDGVAGFGKTPELAMIDFDKSWDVEIKLKG